MLAGAALANPVPMLSRLVRGCIVMAFTARVRRQTVSCQGEISLPTVQRGVTTWVSVLYVHVKYHVPQSDRR